MTLPNLPNPECPVSGVHSKSIREHIATRIADEKIGELAEVQNDLVSGANIEHLITLYEVSGARKHINIAQTLKRLFREEIQKTIKELGDSFSPDLFTSLIDMHLVAGLNEELAVILTTNYEDLIERAMKKVYGGINYVIGTVCDDAYYCVDTKYPPILKLHGSFNWKTEYPITIQSDVEREEDTLWIPPGVTKRKEFYPFNVIWGKAKELLDCDILRIIGSSLSQNDWELISLVHSTQKLRTDGKEPYTIEFIGYPKTCERVLEEYPYLRVKTVLEMNEFRDFIIDTYLPTYIGSKEPPEDERIMAVVGYITENKANVFDLWLKAKGDELTKRGISLETPNNYFQRFIRGEL